MVGIDATLDEIENFLSHHQWGTVYSFLMNSEGETIFHPRLKPSTAVGVWVGHGREGGVGRGGVGWGREGGAWQDKGGWGG